MGDELSDYRRALEFLFARTTGQWKLGLDRVEAFLHRMGDPHRAVPVVHIAGTNGKGSVCATLDAVLRARGLRVARYTSPHLVDFTERFLIDGAPVPAEWITAWIREWTGDVEATGATFFEATTAMAFTFFARAGVDVAVIETGMGGRLDATNVVDPLVAGVTNIGLDHQEFLGATRELIAAEKAGIFKPGRPAVVGEPESAIRAQLMELAAMHGASSIDEVQGGAGVSDVVTDALGTSFRWRGRGYRTPLVGAHQAANAATALAMLNALPTSLRPTTEAVDRGLRAVRLPGRFHHVGRTIFDVAHNPDGAQVLADTLRAVRPAGAVTAVLSVLGDKDWAGILARLAPVVSRFVLTEAPSAPASRAWRVREVAAHCAAEGIPAEVETDLGAAIARADRLGSTTLITGSFHTVGDAMALLAVSPTAG
ncbi:MAG: bifunctional folylpolyglutamate synthase/dihydrofolate synthase [Gemmatimonadaceae bacterium]|nr:bifunctional folylpolyglutamate synthase/dihydrofolate synthase [Gemmatimonadaceae bacterium]